MTSCVRSPNSATMTMAKLAAATGRKPWATARSGAASAPSPRRRHSSHALNRNSAATTASSVRCGSRGSRPPATTARQVCTANAAATPAKTGSGRCRVPSTRLANAVLSGSSAGNTSVNATAQTARLIDATPYQARPRPGVHTPPARQLLTAAEGLAQRGTTAPRPGHRALAGRPDDVPGGELLPFAVRRVPDRAGARTDRATSGCLGAAPSARAAPVEALRRRAEVGRRLVTGRLGDPHSWSARAARPGYRHGSRGRGLGPHRLLEAEQGGRRQRDDAGVGVGEHHAAPVWRRVGDDHRARRQPLQLMLLHKELA